VKLASQLHIAPILRTNGTIAPYVFVVWGFVKQRDNFTLPLPVLKHFAMKIYGEMELKFHSFLTSSLDGDE
jgi:hypothetical protein